MDKETFFFTLFFIWYIREYGLPHNLLLIFVRFYQYSTEFLEYFNEKIAPDYFKRTTIKEDDEDIIVPQEEIKREEPKPQPKYEDKFLNEIRKLDKEFVFDEQEKTMQAEKFLELHASLMQSEYWDKLTEIKDKFGEIEMKLTKYESNSEDDYCVCDDEDDPDECLGETKDERIKNLLNMQQKLWEEEKLFKQEYETPEGLEKFIKKIQQLSREFVIKKRLEKLENCYVIEHTPLGNVLMIYDNKRESFKYFSDNSIPYRYLEVVGRKYVKQFGCRPIFVDMEEELKIAEEKWEREKKEKEEKEAEEKRRKEEEAAKNIKPVEEKKNVFAKFKSYNKEAGTGHVNIAAPPKNSIPNKNLTEQQENEKVLLKEKANRYTYEGKFANFSFTKKIDRKAVDKKFAMSFADFKKNILSK